MVALVRSDLEFILDQIRLAETGAQPGNPFLPHGLRTVDGTGNNLLPGQGSYGSADQVMPRLTEPTFRAGEENPFVPGVQPTSYAQTTGSVFDSQPRTISNLIVDQTDGNPAAQEADTANGGEDNGVILNVTPDAGLSAPYNSWFTLFGQFFDHGLDLTNKGGSGTVFVPLRPDDPLYDKGADGIAGTADDGHANFMVLTRATNQPGPDGRLGTADDVHEHVNQTTSFVDQNQTYTSHPSHQAFLREYVREDGETRATGRLLESPGGGPATWAIVKESAREFLGIELSDADVTNLPLIATDAYGNFIPGAGGYARLVLSGGGLRDGAEGGASTEGTVRTGHAFLDDIAHTAAPTGKTADADDAVGLSNGDGAPTAGSYDDELLDAHYATGDGRGNENIGLTAVHHVFHAEHNRLVEAIKGTIEASGDAAFVAEWQLPDGTWNGERLFQAAKFATEMQYQHLVFEEFARKIQPMVNLFDAYDTTIDPSIVAEFAHTVYRFGHSMLRETVDRVNADGSDASIGLIEAFLNPLEFAASGGEGSTAAEAAGAIVRGMTRQVGNEIDEFVTPALRDSLLGLPLDLAAINIARGRDTGVPSLNEARRQFFEATGGDSALRPYDDWADFGLGLRNPASLVNFVAAYGTHDTITGAATLADKRAAAAAIVLGGEGAPDNAVDFLNARGEWATKPTGLDAVDFWIGGLAEKPMPFGGLLGSTFNFVFETQLERLQDGDRFYYLSRTLGMNLFTQLEENSFAELIMRNTDTKHLPFDVFSTPTRTIEAGDETTWPEGEVIGDSAAGTLRYTGVDHVVIGGTEGDDRLRSSEGDDTIWGDGGDDVLEGGAGNDSLLGGEGNDVITDGFGDETIKGDAGNDTINAGPGLDLVLGGFGDDYVDGGEDATEVFAGAGNDIVVAGDDTDEVVGNEGDDWLDGGASGDLLIGDMNDPLGLGTTVGNDVLVGGSGTDRMEGEDGDDIFVGGNGQDRHIGLQGFDWMTYERDAFGVTADLTLRADVIPPPTPSPDAVLDRFQEVEGLSGSAFDDALLGDLEDANGLVADRVDLIAGLRTLLGPHLARFTVDPATGLGAGGNIILGGNGSDRIEGRAGDDVIDGDAYLHVAVRRDAGLFTRITREILTPAAADTADDTDVAVYSDAIANYDVRRIAPDTFTVTHARGTQADGTDVVRNVERLEFAGGGSRVLGGTNTAATGTVTVSDATPTEDQLLSATAVLADADGFDPASVRLSWQAETEPGVWTEVGAGATFRPGDAQAGLRLRVMAGFTDELGAVEAVESAPTAAVQNVNDASVGAPTLDDTTPTEGQAVTASALGIADADGIVAGTVAFRWQALVGVAWRDIAGAAGETFTPAQAQVGQPIRAVVTYTDRFGTVERVNSAPTRVVGDLFVGTNRADAPVLTAGDDVAFGNRGDDTLDGRAGDDRLEGGVGNDTYVVGEVGDVVVEAFGAGTDTVRTTLSAYALGAEVENLAFTGVGVFVGTGNALSNAIGGGTGADVLDGGAGADTLAGGGGADAYRVDVAGDVIVEGAAGGVDTVLSTSATYTLAANVENLQHVGAGATAVTGNALANELIGGGEGDALDGLGGADALLGGAGADRLDGGGGGDALDGGAGADRLLGGAGNDRLDGGADGDVFAFGAGFGRDRVRDFDADPAGGQDLLDVAALGVTAGGFASAVRIAQSGADTVVTVGGGTITLQGVSAATIDASDFVLLG